MMTDKDLCRLLSHCPAASSKIVWQMRCVIVGDVHFC
jgi:hypothetical protein